MERICITPENVDELVEKYAEEYWAAKDIAATFSSIGRNTIVDWAHSGEVRWYAIEKRVKHQPWNRYNVADCITARMRHRKLRPFLRRRREDGTMEYQCNGPCGEWKGEDGFYVDRKRAEAGHQGLLPYCKKCHNDAGRKRRSENPEIKLKERAHFNRRYNDLKQRRIAAKKWKAPKWIESKGIVELIDARFPKLDPEMTQSAHDRRIAEGGHLNVDIIRGLRRQQKTRLETVDRIFTALDMTHELSLIHAEIEKDRPRWHPNHPYCVTCHRDDKTYMARGMCSTCYRHRNDPDYIPVTGTKWSLRYAACVECHRDDRPHAARGLCGTCWQRKRKAGQLEAVGSGHGNDGLVQRQVEAPTDGSVGRGHLGRVSGNA